jgi:hypothetical protein
MPLLPGSLEELAHLQSGGNISFTCNTPSAGKNFEKKGTPLTELHNPRPCDGESVRVHIHLGHQLNVHHKPVELVASNIASLPIQNLPCTTTPIKMPEKSPKNLQKSSFRFQKPNPVLIW